MIRPKDMRFHGNAELEFKRSLEPQLRFTGAVFFFTVFIASVGSTIPIFVQEVGNENDPFSFAKTDVRTLPLILALLMCASSGVAGCLCLTWTPSKGHKAVGLESIIVAALICLAVMMPFSSRWALPTMMGASPAEVWKHNPRSSEPRIIMGLVALISAVCIFLPIRTCTVWTILLAAWAAFTTSTFAASVFPGDEWILSLMLAILFIFSYVGALTKEGTLRKTWTTSEQLQESQNIVLEQRLQIQESLEEKLQEAQALAGAMKNVATYMCDLMITLSNDLRTCNQDAMCDEFFGTDMQGRLFTDVIQPNDNSRFMKVIHDSTETMIPQCLTLTFHANGKAFEANLLVVSSGNAKTSYFVGIRLDRDSIPPNLGVPVLQSDDIPTVAADSTHLPLVEVSDQVVEEADNVFVLFNALSPKMEISFVSPGWVACNGQNAEDITSLVEWMTPTVLARFRAWLAPRVEHALAGEWDPRRTTVPFMRAKSMVATPGHVESQALLTVTFADPSLALSGDKYTVRFSIRQIQACPPRSFTCSSIPEEEGDDTETPRGRAGSNFLDMAAASVSASSRAHSVLPTTMALQIAQSDFLVQFDPYTLELVDTVHAAGTLEKYKLLGDGQPIETWLCMRDNEQMMRDFQQLVNKLSVAAPGTERTMSDVLSLQSSPHVCATCTITLSVPAFPSKPVGHSEDEVDSPSICAHLLLANIRCSETCLCRETKSQTSSSMTSK